MILRKLLAKVLAGDAPRAGIDAMLQQARDLQGSGEHERAQQCYRSILALQPRHGEAQGGLARLLGTQGEAHQAKGEIEAAIECYLEALSLAPEAARLRNNLGNAYLAAGQLDEAVAAFGEALELAPGLAEAHLNLAIVLHRRAATGEASAHYRRAIALAPALAEAHLNLGFLLQGEGDVAGATACYAAAVAARPDFASAHFNLALQQLLAGDFERGWEAYEWRLRLPELAALWPYRDRARWDGAALAGRTIVLYAEQGFGDAIQFVRYAPLVAERGGRVIVVCQPKLAPLFASVPGVCAAHAAGAPDPAFDVCCSLLSLPRLFRTRIDSIPAKPYLRADPAKVAAWRSRLAAERAPLKVGLYWATDAKSAIGGMKSLEIGALAPLARVPGVVFYSLQRGAAAAEIARAPAGMTIRDAAADLRDFADDAALMSCLDLVISIDTATAHLAGALGRPVWTLVHFPTEWRWLLGRDDSPWYPSMRLFRQGPGEPWERVLDRVASALGDMPKTAPN